MSGSISSYVGHCWYVVSISISYSALNCAQGLIFLFIAVQFGMYIMIRQLVNAKEWVSACMYLFLISAQVSDYGSRARS